MLLGVSNAKVSKEDIFKPKSGPRRNSLSGGMESNSVHSARRPLITLLYLPRVIMMMEKLVE
jgi:hypothetical protein